MSRSKIERTLGIAMGPSPADRTGRPLSPFPPLFSSEPKPAAPPPAPFVSPLSMHSHGHGHDYGDNHSHDPLSYSPLPAKGDGAGMGVYEGVVGVSSDATVNAFGGAAVGVEEEQWWRTSPRKKTTTPVLARSWFDEADDADVGLQGGRIGVGGAGFGEIHIGGDGDGSEEGLRDHKDGHIPTTATPIHAQPSFPSIKSTAEHRSSSSTSSPVSKVAPSTSLSPAAAPAARSQFHALAPPFQASILQTQAPATQSQSQPQPQRGARFWLIFLTLCMGQLLCAFETTVTATALPSIVRALGGGGEYVWVMNGYLLAVTVSQPVYGQIAGICGRRYPLVFAVAVFTVGSALSGAATYMKFLIAGRVVQGIGGGGIVVMTQIIISDLFSVRERGKYLGLLYGVFGIGLATGPIFGGEIVQHGDWRWVFYLNVPIGGAVLIAQLLFLHVTYKKTATVRERLKKVDWVGNGLLIASVTSILIALSWADVKYPWSSPHILVPLITGFAGTALFHAYETSRFCKIPTLPPQLFTNRTCAAALTLTFLQMMLTFWRIYFLSVYLQAVLLHSPGRAGVLMLPSFVSSMPIYVISGHILTKTGRYKPLHHFGVGILVVAAGFFTLFDAQSSLLEIVVFQVLAGISTGCLITTLLPAAQADMPQSMVAAVTAGLGFVRMYGSIWGIAIPAAIFNARFEQLRQNMDNVSVSDAFKRGAAYAYANAKVLDSLDAKTQEEVIGVYTGALRLIWQVALLITIITFLVVFAEKEVVMKTQLESDYKLRDRSKPREVNKRGGA